MADIEIYDGKVKQLKEDIKELINSGKAFTLGKDTAKFSEMKSQYSAESAKFKKMGSDLGAAFVQIKDEYSDYLKRLKTKPINKVVSLLKKLKTQLLGCINHINRPKSPRINSTLVWDKSSRQRFCIAP